MNWLKELAPMIGTALGGPLGGIAAGFIADKLGVEEKTVKAVSDVLNSGKMTADQIASLKVAEIEFQKFLKQADIDLERINAADRDSARNMQVQTRSMIPGALAMLITSGFFGILVGMMLGLLNVSDQQSLLILLGALATAWGGVVNFYFGSSHGSQNKDALLAQAGPVK
jgi:gas vesicle protein